MSLAVMLSSLLKKFLIVFAAQWVAYMVAPAITTAPVAANRTCPTPGIK